MKPTTFGVFLGNPIPGLIKTVNESEIAGIFGDMGLFHADCFWILNTKRDLRWPGARWPGLQKSLKPSFLQRKSYIMTATTLLASFHNLFVSCQSKHPQHDYRDTEPCRGSAVHCHHSLQMYTHSSVRRPSRYRYQSRP